MDTSQSAVKKRARKVAKLIVRKGMKVGQAMQEAGFSQAQSKKGFSEIMKRPGLKKALQKEMDKFISETDGLPGAAERAKLIRWRLTKNIVTGKDAAVASCKLAGLDRELNLYQSEHQNNVIVVQLPENFEETMEGSPRTDGFWDTYRDPMCVREK